MKITDIALLGLVGYGLYKIGWLDIPFVPKPEPEPEPTPPPKPLPKVEKGATLSNAQAQKIASDLKGELAKTPVSTFNLVRIMTPISNEKDIEAVYNFFGKLEKSNWLGLPESYDLTQSLNNSILELSAKRRKDEENYINFIRTKYYSYQRDLKF